MLKHNHRIAKRALGALFTLLLVAFALPAAAARVPTSEVAERTDRTPEQLRGVGMDEHLDAALPLGLTFKDETGKQVKLGDYFDGKRPVILTFNYSDCPMLCSLEMSALVKTLKQLEWSAGDKFVMVTVSLDPTLTTAKAQKWKARYVRQYGRPGVEKGWHFLVGSDENVHALAKAVGFKYKYDPKKKMYYHPAVTTLATPKGHVARYLYGIHFDKQTLRLGLVESSQGKIGTTIDKILLYCCSYDPKEGNYALVASKVMTVGGALTVVILGGFLGTFWFAESKRRKKKRKQQAGAEDKDEGGDDEGES